MEEDVKKFNLIKKKDRCYIAELPGGLIMIFASAAMVLFMIQHIVIYHIGIHFENNLTILLKLSEIFCCIAVVWAIIVELLELDLKISYKKFLKINKYYKNKVEILSSYYNQKLGCKNNEIIHYSTFCCFIIFAFEVFAHFVDEEAVEVALEEKLEKFDIVLYIIIALCIAYIILSIILVILVEGVWENKKEDEKPKIIMKIYKLLYPEKKKHKFDLKTEAKNKYGKKYKENENKTENDNIVLNLLEQYFSNMNIHGYLIDEKEKFLSDFNIKLYNDVKIRNGYVIKYLEKESADEFRKRMALLTMTYEASKIALFSTIDSFKGQLKRVNDITDTIVNTMIYEFPRARKNFGILSRDLTRYSTSLPYDENNKLYYINDYEIKFSDEIKVELDKLFEKYLIDIQSTKNCLYFIKYIPQNDNKKEILEDIDKDEVEFEKIATMIRDFKFNL